MKYRIAALVLILVALLAPLTAAAQPALTGTVNTGALNLRTVPGATNNVPLLEIPGGAVVTVLGRDTSGEWYRVTYDANGYSPVTGWVRGRYITLSVGAGSPLVLPIVEQGNLPTVAVGVIDTGALNIRSVPSALNNQPLAVLYRGTTVEVLGRSTDSEWLWVIFGRNGQLGWARARYVSLNGLTSVGTLPIVESGAPHVEVSLSGTVNTGALNIRPVPRWFGNQPLTFVYRNTPLEIIGRNSDASWYQVRLSSGLVGWARSRYVNVSNGDIGALPIVG